MKLVGKNALITGGTTGIGYETAKLFIKNGARVAITGQNHARLEAARANLGEGTIAIRADSCSINEIQQIPVDLSRSFEVLDVLFVNAGIAYATPLLSTSETEFDRLMDINFKATFFTVQQCVPLMRKGGSIVLNTSWLNQVGTPGLAALSASKAAVRSLARSLSAELLSTGVRVNAVSPGAINTPIHAKTGMPANELAEFAQRLEQKIPLGRFGTAA